MARQRLECGGTTPLLLHACLASDAFEFAAAFALATVQEKRGHVPAVQKRATARSVSACPERKRQQAEALLIIWPGRKPVGARKDFLFTSGTTRGTVMQTGRREVEIVSG